MQGPHAYPPPAAPRWPSSSAGWAWFCAWTLVGAAGALGSISLGVIALAPAVVAAALMWRSPTGRNAAFGFLAGDGLVSLVVAYVQRDGPGTTCWHTATAAGCDQHLNPIPWLIVGVVLVVGAIAAQIRRSG